ncbi:uncharacterized protein LOC142239524 [Haematobia irritans]|uniref:uncharacterized protein LOC142239524 n=1 Tax=Haematobia irritans TaxID=7368 RepID=UPI003F507AC4
MLLSCDNSPLFHHRHHHRIMQKNVIPKITNAWVKCTIYDNDFAKFLHCNLTKNAKKDPLISFHLKLFQMPVTNCMTHIEMHYFTLNSRLPIVPVNSSWDACKFMADRKRFVAFLRLYNMLGPYTNLNHTCPYRNDIIGKNILVDTTKFPFPILPGEYMITTSYFINGTRKLSIDGGGHFL